MSLSVDSTDAAALRPRSRWAAWLSIQPGEARALAWSFAYFYCLLCAYYVIRPMRDEMVVRFGAGQMQWIYTAVFFIMLALVPAYGWLVARWPRRRFLPILYLFFIACLGGFWLLFQYNAVLATAFGVEGSAFGRGSAAALAIWITVFNLFVVSVFWSFMSDIYSPEQSRRLFATIATGGTLGALTGPLITRYLAQNLSVDLLLLVSASLLLLCLACIAQLVPWARVRERASGDRGHEEPIGGSVLAGARLVFQQPILRRLAVLMVLGVAVGTLLYNRQLHLQSANPDSGARVVFFAHLDLWINLVAIVLQLGLTRFLLMRFGAARLLMAPALAVMICFAIIYAHPAVLTVAIAQVVTRGFNFGMLSPARETLFTQVDREARYKAKNFIDTAVWRGGDIMTQWGIVVLAAAGMVTSSFALLGIGVAVAWFAIAWSIRRWEKTTGGG